MSPTALQRLLPLEADRIRLNRGPEEMPYDDLHGDGWSLTSCDVAVFVTIDALSDTMPHDRITIARNLAYAAEAIANLSATLLDNELNKESTP